MGFGSPASNGFISSIAKISDELDIDLLGLRSLSILASKGFPLAHLLRVCLSPREYSVSRNHHISFFVA